MMDRISYMVLTFENEFYRDHMRWPNQGSHPWNSPVVRNLTFPLEQTEFLHWWLNQRIVWLDEWLDV